MLISSSTPLFRKTSSCCFGVTPRESSSLGPSFPFFFFLAFFSFALISFVTKKKKVMADDSLKKSDSR